MSDENLVGSEGVVGVLDDLIRYADNRSAGLNVLKNQIKWDQLTSQEKANLWHLFREMND